MKFRDVLIGIGIVVLAISLTICLISVVYIFFAWAIQSIGGI
jgi:hypothetical protein